MENIKFERPDFFHYPKKHSTDYGFETLQDFMLSWTFRWSEKKYEIVDSKIYNYSRKIIYGLIFGKKPEGYVDGKNLILSENIPEDFEVEKVEVHRQWKQIDLIAEITVLLNNVRSQHVLNIENKWYTKISNGQLNRAAQNIIDQYSHQWNIRNYVIYCDNCNLTENLSKQCDQDGFILISVEDLQDIAGMKSKRASLTSSDLFNEYWLKHLS